MNCTAAQLSHSAKIPGRLRSSSTIPKFEQRRSQKTHNDDARRHRCELGSEWTEQPWCSGHFQYREERFELRLLRNKTRVASGTNPPGRMDLTDKHTATA